MKTEIFYFSGTGNSFALARDLGESMPGSVVSPIAGLVTNEHVKTDAERIGFVFPLFFWGVPEIVQRFVRKIEINNASYVFFAVTSGGLSSPHYVSGFFKKELKRKGARLNSGFRVVMPSNYIRVYDLEPQKRIDKKIRNMKFMVNSISKTVKTLEDEGLKDRIPFVSYLFNRLWEMRLKKSDKDFYADEKCNKCGTCLKICPVSNITLMDGKPVWNGKCQECLACLHYCPQTAIQSRNKTEHKGRYHHPDLPAVDIALQKNGGNL